MLEPKKVSESTINVTNMVLPNDTNPVGFLRGGVMMEWMDIAAEIAAQKHAHCVALTIAIDAVKFKSSIKSGDTVYLKAQITRVFSTSMEIYVQAWATSLPEMKMRKTNEAFFTFVAINELGKPTQIPQVIPETEEEKILYQEAEKKRINRRDQA